MRRAHEKENDMLWRVVSACLGWGMLVTSTGVTAADGPVLLGAVYNLSGPQAAFDQPSARGAELAVARANSEGGVLGRQVELVIADPEGSLDRVAAATSELIDAHPTVVAVLGLSDTDMVLASAPVAAGRQLLFMTAGATSPKLPAQVPEHLFLACFGDNLQAAAAAEFAYHDLAARTASIVHNSATTYTTLLQEYFRARFEKLGGRIVAARKYGVPAGRDAALVDLPAADVVFLSAQEPAEAAAGIVGLREAGIAVPIIGGDGFDSEDEWSKHPDLGDVYFTTHVWLAPDNPDPAVRAFDDAYRRAYERRAPNGFAALGHDAVGVLLAAIAAAGSAEPARVLALLAQLEDYRGVTGTISYEGGSRIPTKSVTILEVRGGKPALVKQLMPERVPPP
jgi:branched-chain amino acid transport system substrate-binding protein